MLLLSAVITLSIGAVALSLYAIWLLCEVAEIKICNIKGE